MNPVMHRLAKTAAKLLSATAAMMMLLPAYAENKTMYARRDGVKVYSEANLKSSVITQLKAGDPVTVVDGGNSLFLKIQLKDGKTGFSAYMSLAEKVDPSWGKISSFVKGMTKPQDNSAEEARTRTANAVMGIRGLTATEGEAMGRVSNARPNLKAVYAMEERKSSDKLLSDLGDAVLMEIEKRTVESGNGEKTP